MKTVEDQYIDMVTRDNLLAELSAATGATIGEADFDVTDRVVTSRRTQHGYGAVHDIAESRSEGVPSDAEIEREVRGVLQRDPIIRLGWVAPHVHAGWVTLQGRVEHVYEKQEAEDAVLELENVRGVIDHLSVGPPMYDGPPD
jgi:osmotically-inducible protein OsmY